MATMYYYLEKDSEEVLTFHMNNSSYFLIGAIFFKCCPSLRTAL